MKRSHTRAPGVACGVVARSGQWQRVLVCARPRMLALCAISRGSGSCGVTSLTRPYSSQLRTSEAHVSE